ncbi:MAG: hypothetical protein CL510_10155 [Actinobacteria bacterium]|jgi:hypothetical protein|nr:hypothetical protein [Actinomycetota bacterium]|tara:strand:+ start:662 stop:1312 length:651 start_codon:yes stop_codon:yes gene_type:complete
MARVIKYPGIEKLGRKATQALYDEAKARGWNIDDLLGQIWIESGFRSGIRTYAAKKDPRQTASGLIQMTDASARYSFPHLKNLPHKKAAEAVRNMSPLEQVPGIFKYYGTAKGKLSGADFRILGYSLSPGLLSAPDSRVMYEGEAVKINPGAAENGKITVGSVKREWARNMANRQRFGTIEISDLPDVEPKPSEAGVPIMALLVGAFILVRRKGKR